MFDTFNLWLAQAHFLRPLWLLALLPVVLLVLVLWRRRRQAGQWQKFVAPHLLPHLLEGEGNRRKRAPLLGLLALWSLAVIALAGPTWQKIPQPVQKSGSALVILWDMSPSMMAQDMEPSRLARSRLKLIDLLRARDEGVTALVAYAGESHVVTPLTGDTETIINLLSALSPAVMPLAGSNPEMALRTAYRLLENAGVARGNILFVTDGIVPQAFDTLARISQDSQHQITIWGLGTTAGAPIPLPRNGFARDASGNMVLAELNQAELQGFAANTNAYYVPLLKSNQDIETLQHLFVSPDDTLRQTDRVFDTWYEQGPWLLLALLPCIALLFRRGWLMCLPLFMLPLTLPQPAQASVWDDLWQTSNQQAQEALSRKQPGKAAQLFQSPGWRGTALYRAENYDAALKAFHQGEATSDNLYNQGNSLMQLGQYQAAIEAYETALKKNPDNTDAIANKKLAEKLLRQKQKQKQKQQQEKQGNKNQEQQQGKSQDNKQKPQGKKQTGENGQQPNQPYDDPSNNKPKTEQAKQKKGEKKPENKTAQAKQEPAEDKKQQQCPAATQLSQAEREKQQTLEQWLRKVPDNPGGLLRNKFLYEYRQRRRTGNWQAPENNAAQRW